MFDAVEVAGLGVGVGVVAMPVDAVTDTAAANDGGEDGDIEEALAELFDAKDKLDELGDLTPEIALIRRKVTRAVELLDRPWP